MPAASPTSAEVRDHILAAAKAHRRLVHVRTVLETNQGRPIDAVTITDPQTGEVNKQNVLIVAGQHGNEESGRLIALALVDFLTTRAAATILKHQKIVIMPNVSPDAAEQDTYETPSGVRPNLDHSLAGPRSPEGKAVEAIAYELQPELFVDMHARGFTGHSYDMVLYPVTRDYTEDDNLLHDVALQMVAAGEKAGIPHVTHSLAWGGWGGPDINQPSTTCFCYRTFKSMVLLTETAEHNAGSYPEELRIKAGLARMKTLLSLGQKRHPKLYYPGYPYYMSIGMFQKGMVAVGKTAAARRESRIALWRNAPAFKKVEMRLPEPPRSKHLRIEYEGPDLKNVGLQVRAAGRMRVKGARLNGERLRESQTHGYITWRDACSTFAVVAMPELKKGVTEVEVEFG